ncbi:unnamed protein product [Ceratitis capitata]|uniref:(Mediterranean fruit fly) hypothetical protein n=1 Tax=Ceratitis capitata TaxID=7213 RepID=A0A811UT17_CERCA|nr:unnamed protein product [Ceratitis capitata]
MQFYGKSTPSLVSSLSAAAAPAATASHAQSPHHNSAAAVVAVAATSSSFTSGAPITSNFGSLLDVISGSGASAEKIDADFNDAMNAIANYIARKNTMTRYTHMEYVVSLAMNLPLMTS